jgi:serine/threonine protein kinase
VIGQTISHYKIISRLGAGGMGIVYEAEDTRLGRKVAIKFLPEEANADAEAIQRFQREARVISNLNHPFICTLYDIGTHHAQPDGRAGQGGKQFMVMELLDDQTLKDRLERGALPVDEVLELGAEIADALDAAHAQGVIHRDIKPANLFVTRRGTIKVLDFGVAKLSEAGRSGDGIDVTMGGSDQLTTIGTTIGTVAYMSPEQARGQEIDARSDLFSAGVVLYEMTTGQLPFQGATVATIFEGLLTKAPIAASEIKAGIPAEARSHHLEGARKDRKRYQGAAELRADLKRLKRAADSGLATAVTASGASQDAPLRDSGRGGGSLDPPAKSGWRKPVFIGAPLLTALAVAGFFFYRSINTPALTQKDSVISSVVNRTRDTMFDDTLGEALGLQLRQSPFLNVVLSSRCRPRCG